VFLTVPTLTLLFSLTVLKLEVFFTLLDRKFNEDFKNVLKLVIFSLQMGFTGRYVLDYPFKLCLSVQILTLVFYLTVPSFVVFFTLLNLKINEDSKKCA